MPMSPGFNDRLEPDPRPDRGRVRHALPHLRRSRASSSTGSSSTALFSGIDGFREYYAVKALPNLRILELVQSELGFGFDCSSTPELRMVRSIGAKPEDIMFTSNNTSPIEYDEALGAGGCILNLDDITFIEKLPRVPELVCFRYNPGNRRTGNAIIGTPEEAKYGLRHDQIKDAYLRARARRRQPLRPAHDGRQQRAQLRVHGRDDRDAARSRRRDHGRHRASASSS